MRKTLLICLLAVAITGCVEHRRERYVPTYQYAPACGCAQQVTSCTTCQQVMPAKPCCGFERPAPQPKTVVIMVPPAPAPAPQPQPVIEHEIVYQPQPTCGCKKCGCQTAAQ